MFRHIFTKLVVPAALTLWSAMASHAANFSFHDSFSQDDTIQQLSFLLDTPGTVTLRTWSFAGGANAAGDLIAPGGFAPVLSLFDPTGLLLRTDAGGPPCGSRDIDPASGACWDAYMELGLGAGTYTLVLTQAGNTVNGSFLADGFSQAGQGNYTGPQYLGIPGSFILDDGTQRTGSWAVDILGADDAKASASAPEPASAALLAAGLAGLLAVMRRRRTA